jgi:hypothetical protein
MINMGDSEFKAAVEVSRKWDGTEVAKELSNKIKNKITSPKFILLFTTIHYEKEFEKILNGLKNEFSDSPLIGGTVAGFMTQDGCYTRGVAVLTVDYPNLKVSIGLGQNTKKNPERASNDFSEMIINNLGNQNFSNKILLSFPSACIVPSLTGGGSKKLYKSKLASSMILHLLKTSLQVSQKGVGREDVLLDKVTKNIPEFNIVGGSLIDDNKMEKNFQFFNEKIFTNSIIGLALNTDMDFILCSEVAVEKTELSFKAAIADEKYVIKQLDGKSATKTFFEYLNWPDSLMDDRVYRMTFFYPILFEENDELFPNVIGGFIGDNIACGFDFKSNNLCIGRSSRSILINSLKKELEKITKVHHPKLGFIIYCSALLETLGRDFFKVQEIIKEKFVDSPFLLLATGGEDIYIPNKLLKHSNETINMLAFY